jgi:hypothetical protein
MSIILLTTTVNVQKKDWLREANPLERIVTYTRSLSFWLKETKLPIVVVENNGYTFEEWNNWKEQYKDRLEIITFREKELNKASYLREDTSKGASEIFAIEYAYLHSKWIKNYSFLIKITGRFFIPGLELFLRDIQWDNYIALNQHDIEECQMVGVNLKNFYDVFDPILLNKDGKYEPHVEYIYKERILAISVEKIIRCPSFPVDPIMSGGNDRIFHYI